MKKLVLAIIILASVTALFAGSPHTVYIELVTTDGIHPDEATFTAWILGRENEVLTETSNGCEYYGSGDLKGTASIQCGSFTTQWEVGDTLHVEAVAVDGMGWNEYMLNAAGYQCFGDMYGQYSEGPGIIIDDTPIGGWGFDGTPRTGSAPLEVHFSIFPPIYDDDIVHWDFDNDGIIDAEGKFPVYTYTEAGVYSVTVKLGYNESSFETKTAIDYITVGETANSPTVLKNSIYIENHPNPFNPTTIISFSIPKDAQADILIYNTKGQRIRKLEAGSKNSGINYVIWNGKDDNGKNVTSGIYFYELNLNGKTVAVKKCVLMK